MPIGDGYPVSGTGSIPGVAGALALSDLRAAFKTESGRNDLSNPQIDFYLNEGIRHLDRLTGFAHCEAKQYISLQAGASVILFSSDCRTILAVSCIRTDGRAKLDRQSYTYVNDLRLSTTAQPGTPLYYSPRIIRPHPISFDKTEHTDFIDYIDTETASEYSSYTNRGLILAPVADVNYLIEIEGLFYTPSLSSSNTQNWWVVNHYLTVLKAAMFILYSGYRNMEGMKTYSDQIALNLRSLDLDEAEEESNEIERMEG